MHEPMNETPDFTMQCPKCGKDFPIDATHCEECSAMLEPVEVSGKEAAGRPETASAGTAAVPGAEVSVSDEKIEDIKIDSLKADIENRFLFALLLELDQLRKRLSGKEKLLSELHERQQAMSHADYVTRTGRLETEGEELLTRIARIESIIENLEKNIESDIQHLETTVRGLKRPSFTGRFKPAGRYYRLISSELGVKTVLLGIIRGRLPRTYFRTKRMVRMAAIGSAGICCTVLLSWFVVSQNQPATQENPAAATETARKAPVSEQDVLRLLEDIRTANLTKNLTLWESRYSVSYPGLKEKRKDIAEQWKKFDYISLRYRTENLRVGSGDADAVIVWDMDLRPLDGGPVQKIVSRLASNFVLEDGILRIASVRKDQR